VAAAGVYPIGPWPETDQTLDTRAQVSGVKRFVQANSRPSHSGQVPNGLVTRLHEEDGRDICCRRVAAERVPDDHALLKRRIDVDYGDAG